jgi:hypothetical protein
MDEDPYMRNSYTPGFHSKQASMQGYDADKSEREDREKFERPLSERRSISAPLTEPDPQV